MKNETTLVTPEEFTEKMNQVLHRNPEHEGMHYHFNQDGLCLHAPSLSVTARMALDKAIFDDVSKHYSIARP
jgi:hypothetical protein